MFPAQQPGQELLSIDAMSLVTSEVINDTLWLEVFLPLTVASLATLGVAGLCCLYVNRSARAIRKEPEELDQRGRAHELRKMSTVSNTEVNRFHSMTEEVPVKDLDNGPVLLKVKAVQEAPEPQSRPSMGDGNLASKMTSTYHSAPLHHHQPQNLLKEVPPQRSVFGSEDPILETAGEVRMDLMDLYDRISAVRRASGTIVTSGDRMVGECVPCDYEVDSLAANQSKAGGSRGQRGPPILEGSGSDRSESCPKPESESVAQKILRARLKRKLEMASGYKISVVPPIQQGFLDIGGVLPVVPLHMTLQPCVDIPPQILTSESGEPREYHSVYPHAVPKNKGICIATTVSNDGRRGSSCSRVDIESTAEKILRERLEKKVGQARVLICPAGAETQVSSAGGSARSRSSLSWFSNQPKEATKRLREDHWMKDPPSAWWSASVPEMFSDDHKYSSTKFETESVAQKILRERLERKLEKEYESISGALPQLKRYSSKGRGATVNTSSQSGNCASIAVSVLTEGQDHCKGVGQEGPRSILRTSSSLGKAKPSKESLLSGTRVNFSVDGPAPGDSEEPQVVPNGRPCFIHHTVKVQVH